ncbi:hypothetical protein [Streptomyces sp. NPDC001380]|uniref:hypothetical protein n=1 Tax=Streptomyces sp. NPDC001380 TaxID=3364566 RepID=UPI0036A277E5
MSGGLRFLPWVRDGLAGGIDGQPGDGTGGRTGTAVGLTVSRGGEELDGGAVRVTLLGPGDVTGLDPAQVVRSFPAPGSADAETTGFAAVEFARPDLPWLFSPGVPDARGRLRPWLVLVVLREDEAVLDTPAGRAPVLSCPASALPDPARSWAWAHAQAVVEDAADDPAVVLRDHPERCSSRLLCPRPLTEGVRHLAAVVPAFEAGRRAGLGLLGPDDDGGPAADAWNVHASGPVTLPVYHHWSFTAGPEGDFQTLVERLAPRPATGVGARPLDVTGSSPIPVAEGDPGALTVLPSALRAPGTLPAWPLRTAWRTAMRPLMTATDRLTPPLYGGPYVPAGLPAQGQGPAWLETLNLDPRYRAVAALGARIVRDHQEELVAAVWEQVVRLRDANLVLGRAQLARDAGTALYRRRVTGAGLVPAAGLTAAASARLSDAALLAVTRPVHDLVPGTPTAAPTAAAPAAPTAAPAAAAPAAPTAAPAAPATVADLLAGEAPAVAAAVTPAFRRAVRGPVSLGGRLGATADGTVTELAARRVDPVPPAVLPAGAVADATLRDPRGNPLDLALFDPGLQAAADAWWKPPTAPAPLPPATGPRVAITSPVVNGLDGSYVLGSDNSLYELTRGRWRRHPSELWGDVWYLGGGLAASTTERRVFTLASGFSSMRRLIERRWEADRWVWRQHPELTGSCGAPAVAAGSLWLLVGDQLAQMDLSTDTWTYHGKPSQLQGSTMIWLDPDRAPGVLADGSSVFVTTQWGTLYQRQRGTDGVWRWYERICKDPANPTGPDLYFGSAPVPYGSAGVRLAERAWTEQAVTRLWEYRVSGGWVSRGAPPANAGLLGSALGVSGGTGANHIVLRNGAAATVTGLDGATPAWTTFNMGSPSTTVPPTEANPAAGMVYWVQTDGSLVVGGLGRRLGIGLGFPADTSGSGDPDGAPRADRWRFAPPVGVFGSLVVAHLDSPSGPNQVRYRVGPDLGFDGRPRASWGPADPYAGPVFHEEAKGLGTALADLTGNGRPDLVVLTVEPQADGTRRAVYRVGRDLDAAGTATGGWQGPFTVPDPLPAIQACGIAVTDLDGNGRPELVLAYAFQGRIAYRVGWSLGADGTVGDGWGHSTDVPWPVTAEVTGLGIAVTDLLDDDDCADLVVVAATRNGAGDRVDYRVGRRVNRRGRVTGGWTGASSLGGEPTGTVPHQGLGVAVADFTGSRRPDLLVFRIENQPDENRGLYRIGFDLDNTGRAAWWGQENPVAGWWGRESAGAAVAVADLDPALVARRQAVAERFVAAAVRHQARVSATQELTRSVPAATVPIAQAATAVRAALDPGVQVTRRALAQVALDGAPLSPPAGADPLRPLTAAVGFDQPVYELLRALDPEHLLAGGELLPADTLTVLETDPAFLEAFLAGLNTELSRELLWREVPVDPATTWFRTFWDVRGARPAEATDITPMDGWTAGELGSHTTGVGGPGEGACVLLIRGNLLDRYPAAAVTLRRAAWSAGARVMPEGGQELLPLFGARLGAGTRLLCFPVSAAQARGTDGDAGWFVAFREPPASLRFGLDTGAEEPADPLNAAHYALDTLQRPVCCAVHAGDMILPEAARP